MNKFLVHSEALALLLTVSIFQQMSADCCYWFHTISSLWPSERLGVRASVVTANGHCFISTLTYCDKQKHILSEKQKHIYALCARLLCLQSILSKDSKMNDLQGVP